MGVLYKGSIESFGTQDITRKHRQELLSILNTLLYLECLWSHCKQNIGERQDRVLFYWLVEALVALYTRFLYLRSYQRVVNFAFN
jgi:hypothetical protein